MKIQARPCRSCGAPIFDLRHVDTGRHAPIDAEPVQDGNIAVDLESGTYRLIGRDLRGLSSNPTYRSHFMTCPQATSWRARRAAAAHAH